MVNNWAVVKSFTCWILGLVVPCQGHNNMVLVDGEAVLVSGSGNMWRCPALCFMMDSGQYGCLHYIHAFTELWQWWHTPSTERAKTLYQRAARVWVSIYISSTGHLSHTVLMYSMLKIPNIEKTLWTWQHNLQIRGTSDAEIFAVITKDNGTPFMPTIVIEQGNGKGFWHDAHWVVAKWWSRLKI